MMENGEFVNAEIPFHGLAQFKLEKKLFERYLPKILFHDFPV